MEDDVTKNKLLDLEEPRVYQASYLGGQNGNPRLKPKTKKEGTRMRNHKMFYLVSSLVLSMLVLNPGYVQAQTPGQIAKFDPAANPGNCSNAGIDCVDSVITEDFIGRIGIGTTSPIYKLDVSSSRARLGTSSGTDGPYFNLQHGGEVGGRSWFLGSSGSQNSAGLGNFAIFDGTAGLDRVVIDGLGNVRIGPPTPAITRLTVNNGSSVPGDLGLLVYGRSGTTAQLRVDTSIPDNPPTYSLDVAGPVPNAGNGKVISHGYDTFSSRRWKTNIQTIQGALEKVERLRGVSFDRKKEGAREIGVVAEEVAEVVPEVVGYEENGKDAMSVDYGRLTALLIEAAKEQQSQIAKLKAEVTVLKSQKDAEIANLKARLDKLEGMVRNAAYHTASSGPAE